MYAIYDAELEGIYIGPDSQLDILAIYERDQLNILALNNTMYGAKLVKLKTIKIGVQIKIRLIWNREYWHTKPFITRRTFRFLFISIERIVETADVFDKVIKDFVNGIE